MARHRVVQLSTGRTHHETDVPQVASDAVERLTRDVAEAAWAELGRIEEAGGIEAALADGSLQARIDELSRAYAVQGLAIEELTDERDRYREVLTTLEVQAVSEIAPDWVGIPTVEFEAAMKVMHH